jgi:hypothetical protein
MTNRTKIIVACVVCLAVGYFAGREHVKYQMRTAMQDAVKELQTGLSAAFGGGEPQEKKREEPRAPVDQQPIIANLVKKGFSPKDIYNNKYDEEVTITVSFDNKTGKEIRAFDGVLEFTDLLDNRIIGSRVEINEPIAPGAALSWEGALEYNQFMNEHERLRSEPKDNLKIIFHAGKILFADGTTKEYE